MYTHSAAIPKDLMTGFATLDWIVINLRSFAIVALESAIRNVLPAEYLEIGVYQINQVTGYITSVPCIMSRFLLNTLCYRKD